MVVRGAPTNNLSSFSLNRCCHGCSLELGLNTVGTLSCSSELGSCTSRYQCRSSELGCSTFCSQGYSTEFGRSFSRHLGRTFVHGCDTVSHSGCSSELGCGRLRASSVDSFESAEAPGEGICEGRMLFDPLPRERWHCPSLRAASGQEETLADLERLLSDPLPRERWHCSSLRAASGQQEALADLIRGSLASPGQFAKGFVGEAARARRNFMRTKGRKMQARRHEMLGYDQRMKRLDAMNFGQEASWSIEDERFFRCYNSKGEVIDGRYAAPGIWSSKGLLAKMRMDMSVGQCDSSRPSKRSGSCNGKQQACSPALHRAVGACAADRHCLGLRMPLTLLEGVQAGTRFRRTVIQKSCASSAIGFLEWKPPSKGKSIRCRQLEAEFHARRSVYGYDPKAPQSMLVRTPRHRRMHACTVRNAGSDSIRRRQQFCERRPRACGLPNGMSREAWVMSRCVKRTEPGSRFMAGRRGIFARKSPGCDPTICTNIQSME